MALIIGSVKTCVLGLPRPLSLSVPAEAGHCFELLTHVSDSGESLHCFLVGVNKSYNNLWLVTSFMLPTCFLHSPPRFSTLLLLITVTIHLLMAVDLLYPTTSASSVLLFKMVCWIPKCSLYLSQQPEQAVLCCSKWCWIANSTMQPICQQL